MAIAIRGTPTVGVDVGTGTAAVLPAGIANNDLVIVLVAAQPSGRTITPPTDYTQVPNCFKNTTQPTAGVYWHLWKTGDTTSPLFSISGGSTNLSNLCGAYSGVNTSAPIDGSNGQQNTSTLTHTSPSISPAGSADELLMLYALSTGGTSWSTASEGAIEASGTTAPGECWVDLLLSAPGATGAQTVKSGGAGADSCFQVALLGNVTKSQTISATAGATASVVKGVGKIVAASAASSASFAKTIAKTVAASAAATVTITKAVSKTMSASAAAGASMTKQVGKTLAASAASAASFLKTIGKTVSASSAGAASMVKAVSKTLAASAAGVASMTKGITKTLAATAGATAAFTKQIGKTIAAVSGALAYLLNVVTKLVHRVDIQLYADVEGQAVLTAPVVPVATIVEPVQAVAVLYAEVKSYGEVK